MKRPAELVEALEVLKSRDLRIERPTWLSASGASIE